jgi:hypothetical protein
MHKPQDAHSHSSQVDAHADDSDLQKGAIEGAPDGMANENAEGALDESGLPQDEVAIAQDVLGANEDETQG